MEVDPPSKAGTIRYAIQVVVLLAIAATLSVGLVSMTSQDVAEKEVPPAYRFYSALVLVSLLGVTLVALGWMLARFAAFRSRRRTGRTETPYVDAWTVAGQRFQLSEDDVEDQDDEDSAGDSPPVE
jgi:hypothetical protein